MSPKKGTVLAQNDHAPDEARLANLHGDIIATASTYEVDSKLIPASETSEYGVPRTTITAPYSWLGADQVPTELPTGIIGMGARTYIPQLGRFEQTDPHPGGSANAYAYTDDDPVNESDPSGEYTSTVTYDNEAAELGPAAAGLPQEYGGPGAIYPAPVNMQIEEEFNAHPPWDAAAVFDPDEAAGDGGGSRRFALMSSLIYGYVRNERGEGSSNAGGCPAGSKGRSCGSRGGGSPSACEWVAGTGGGLVGGAVGGPFAWLTGPIGAWAATRVCS